ncbi:MAG TPA: GtrA family protein [Sorangium sp.]|nr:GtrA family protein [Sorangium sp.]
MKQQTLGRVHTFVRSALTGGAATSADVLTLALCISAFGVDPRVANVPSLLVGATVQFVGNRHFAFRAKQGSLKRQLGGFFLAETVALVLNGALYDLAAAHISLTGSSAVALRLIVSATVFLLWSYPLWRRVFRTPPEALAPASVAP